MSSRRDFFGSLMKIAKKEEKKEAFAPFPPFFDPSKAQSCLACESIDCVSSCPEGVIKISGYKMPRLDFSLRGCTLCADCASSCKSEVFSPQNSAKICAKLEIDVRSCLAWHKTICKSCFDPCLDRAIDFAGLFYPQIKADKCTACGFCIKVCPVGAISIKEAKEVKEA